MEVIRPAGQRAAIGVGEAKSAKIPLRARLKWADTYLTCLAGDDPGLGRIVAGQKTTAADLAKVGMQLIAKTRNNDEEFREEERIAMNAAKDVWESETVRRAVQGVTKFFVRRDGTEGSATEYSDPLMIKVLEYGERGSWTPKSTLEINGAITFQTAAERQAALAEAQRKMIEESAIDAGRGA